MALHEGADTRAFAAVVRQKPPLGPFASACKANHEFECCGTNPVLQQCGKSPRGGFNPCLQGVVRGGSCTGSAVRVEKNGCVFLAFKGLWTVYESPTVPAVMPIVALPITDLLSTLRRYMAIQTNTASLLDACNMAINRPSVANRNLRVSFSRRCGFRCQGACHNTCLGM